MTYTINRMIPDASIDDVDARARKALADHGFGVLTEIDVKATMKKKLDVDMPAYRILGACNPKMAWQAIGIEPRVGAMLPCNVILREVEGGVEVGAIDPVASMQATDPHRNVGRAIIISIAICVVAYLLVAFAVGASLPLDRIVAAKDYALAEAAEPALGRIGFYLTVALALVATASGVIASIFAVSRMLAMLTDMKLIPHSHFGMPGTIRDHTLVYTVVIASALTIFFDLSRIASLGAFFYLVMDILIHWGVWRTLREEIGAHGWVLLTAIGLDAVVLAAFAALKWQSDPLIVVIAIAGMTAVFLFERIFLALNPPSHEPAHGSHHSAQKERHEPTS